MLKEANELLLKADSIQRQRLARKRLSLAHLGDEKMENEIELKLVSEYKAAASKASTLRAKGILPYCFTVHAINLINLIYTFNAVNLFANAINLFNDLLLIFNSTHFNL